MIAAQKEKCVEYLSDILHVLKSTNQYEQVLHLVVDRITRMYASQTCAVILIDPKTEYLSIENSVGLSYTFCKTFRRKFAVGTIGEVLWTGKPIVIPDAIRDPKLSEEVMLEHRFSSCVCVQLAVDHRTLGYLQVDHTEPNAFAKQDVQTLQVLADIAALAVHKARLHDENLRLDTIDRDTGLEKYTAFVKKLNAALESAKQFNENLAVMILDVDNYKTILNTYGYDNAIKFLKELSGLLQTQLRTVDLSGRYGFDELILMLARTDVESAVEFAQDFCSAVERYSFVNGTIRTTVSIGVAAYPQNGNSTQELLATAKQALFEAQRAGRNNVFFYPASWYESEKAH